MAKRSRKSPVDSARASARRAEYDARRAKAEAETAAYRRMTNSLKGGVPTRTSETWTREQGYRLGTASERQMVIDARSRAYSAYDNNPVAQTLVNTETDNVIGDGLNYQPTSSSDEWNREAKDRYYEWIENCSVRGGDTESGCEVQRLIWSRSRVAGDIGWILVQRDTPEFGIDSRIQVVSAENIVTPDGLHGDFSVFDGIRFDSTGRPVTFYVLAHEERAARRRFIEIMARDFVWLPHMTRPGQARPPSCFITIFERLSELDRYIGGVSLAAWMATVIGLIFKQTNAASQFNALGTLTNSQGNEQKAITLEDGMLKYIGAEDEVVQVNAAQPMTQTPEFIRAMFRTLGQPFDMPLEVIAKDMSTCTFASARIGLLPFYSACRIKASRFASRWSRTIRWWLSREKQRAPGDPKRWKTAFPEDFWNHDLLPNEWDYTDPVSEVQGDMLQVDAGFKSPQMVMAQHGRDPKLITEQRREWLKLTKGLPQLFSTMSREAKPEPAAPTEPAAGRMAEPSTGQGNGNGNY